MYSKAVSAVCWSPRWSVEQCTVLEFVEPEDFNADGYMIAIRGLHPHQAF